MLMVQVFQLSDKTKILNPSGPIGNDRVIVFPFFFKAAKKIADFLEKKGEEGWWDKKTPASSTRGPNRCFLSL
jgi:hypothetical protein